MKMQGQKNKNAADLSLHYPADGFLCPQRISTMFIFLPGEKDESD
jgi:hypothetical protein